MSQNIKFLHFNNDALVRTQSRNIKLGKKALKAMAGKTLAIETLPAQTVKDIAVNIMDYLDGRKNVTLKVGVAKCSIEDSYSRKTGRAVSVEKMKDLNLAVLSMTLSPTHTFIHLSSVEGVSLNLRVNRTTDYCTVTGIQNTVVV